MTKAVPGEKLYGAAAKESKTKKTTTKTNAGGKALKMILDSEEKTLKRITIRIPSPLASLAEERADALDVSFNAYIKRLITEDLQKNKML